MILGNHRDAWVFGAADPNSGTAALMEIARAFSVLRNYGRIRSETMHGAIAILYSVIGLAAGYNVLMCDIMLMLMYKSPPLALYFSVLFPTHSHPHTCMHTYTHIGWRPGRTIVLCSWDAEEYSVVGSTEWVEVSILLSM